jgi:DNA invertase Pin-like site-specific DNA recombinase
MTKREAKKMFGSYGKIAKALGINRSCIGRWKRGVPKKRAEQLRGIHEKGNGKTS